MQENPTMISLKSHQIEMKSARKLVRLGAGEHSYLFSRQRRRLWSPPMAAVASFKETLAVQRRGLREGKCESGMRKAGGRFVRVHPVFIFQWQCPELCMGARAHRGPTAFRLLRPGTRGRRRRQLPLMQIPRVLRPICCPRYLSQFARYPSHLVNIYCPYPLTGSDAHRTRQGIAEDLTRWLWIHHSLEKYILFLFSILSSYSQVVPFCSLVLGSPSWAGPGTAFQVLDLRSTCAAPTPKLGD
jgi:hypothetical protein